MKKKKISGFASFVNSENLIFHYHLIRTGKDMFEWIDYTSRGHITFQNGIPVGSTKVDNDCWPVGKKCKVHARRMQGTGKEFDHYIMQKLSATYNDVESSIAHGVALLLPILEK